MSAESTSGGSPLSSFGFFLSFLFLSSASDVLFVVSSSDVFSFVSLVVVFFVLCFALRRMALCKKYCFTGVALVVFVVFEICDFCDVVDLIDPP